MGLDAAIREAGYRVESILSVGPHGRVRASLRVMEYGGPFAVR